jgi:hypothetical protein
MFGRQVFVTLQTGELEFLASECLGIPVHYRHLRSSGGQILALSALRLKDSVPARQYRELVDLSADLLRQSQVAFGDQCRALLSRRLLSDEFTAWLESQQPDAKEGVPPSAGYVPYAFFAANTQSILKKPAGSTIPRFSIAFARVDEVSAQPVLEILVNNAMAEGESFGVTYSHNGVRDGLGSFFNSTAMWATDGGWGTSAGVDEARRFLTPHLIQGEIVPEMEFAWVLKDGLDFRRHFAS